MVKVYTSGTFFEDRENPPEWQEKVLKETYERRLETTKRRQEVEIKNIMARHEKEIQALEIQYKNMLKLKTSELN